MHNPYASDQYLSRNWHSLWLSSTSFIKSILSCLIFSPAWLAKSLYWRDPSLSRVTLSDKITFSSRKLKNECVSLMIASNYGDVNLSTLDRNSSSLVMTDKTFRVCWFKSVICVLGSELISRFSFRITVLYISSLGISVDYGLNFPLELSSATEDSLWFESISADGWF